MYSTFKRENKIAGLYAILNVPHSSSLKLSEVAQALVGEKSKQQRARTLQLRAKDASTSERIDMLRTIAPICVSSGTALIVNDDLEAATSMGAMVHGLHIGQSDLLRLGSQMSCTDTSCVSKIRAYAKTKGNSNLAVGISTHSISQVQQAALFEPDYIAFGPIFPTASKKNQEPHVGIRQLQKACRIAPCPVVAIGGLQLTTVAKAIQAGAAAVAVISALSAQNTHEIATQASRLAQVIEDSLATRGLYV